MDTESPMINLDSAAVIIPSYNMGWCLARAVQSCLRQSLPVSEIIIVDDCSADDTEDVARDLLLADARVKYFRACRNGGHLSALRCGVHQATTEWIALLDADDELTEDSIECRIKAAIRYQQVSGILPQLIYGDHFAESSGAVTHFTRLEGYVFPFLCRELSLCQTSTIMLGRESVSVFPVSNNPWNTDDEIVVTIGKFFPVLHCGGVVAIYHHHNSPSRMGNSARRRFVGVTRLVRDHQRDILRVHGIRYLLLWYLKLTRAFLRYQLVVIDKRMRLQSHSKSVDRYQHILTRIYKSLVSHLHRCLDWFLCKYFELNIL
jgi:glycosyltransferase involved in cell wall biosynthesis